MPGIRRKPVDSGSVARRLRPWSRHGVPLSLVGPVRIVMAQVSPATSVAHSTVLQARTHTFLSGIEDSFEHRTPTTSDTLPCSQKRCSLLGLRNRADGSLRRWISSDGLDMSHIPARRTTNRCMERNLKRHSVYIL